MPHGCVSSNFKMIGMGSGDGGNYIILFELACIVNLKTKCMELNFHNSVLD